uniref:Alpha N-terminal protein methyltransferase 1 n=1 Tax=Eptatretus burgeri TaxID=7764 RepID=A0A8C4WXK9_EPTBU
MTGSMQIINLSDSEETVYLFHHRVWLKPRTPDNLLPPLFSVLILCILSSLNDKNESYDHVSTVSAQPNKGGARKEFALDCGAGIGRTTKYLLLPIFSRVDMVDMIPLFLRIARKSYLKANIRRVRFICSALQDFRPKWVTGHLTDDDLLEFLRRCRRALRQDGILIIKDNVAHEGVHIDVKDSSVCRARPILTAIFHRAGLRILCEEPQMDFPGEILPVWMFALR